MSHAMSPGPWSRIKRKTDHPLPSPPASIASFTSSDSSCSSSSSLNNFACSVFGEAKTDSPSDELTAPTIIEKNSSVTCVGVGGGGGGASMVNSDLYSMVKESSLLSRCHAFQLHGSEEVSNHRAPLLIQEETPLEDEMLHLQASQQSHLPVALDNLHSYQSNIQQSSRSSSFHMPKSPHHQVHPAHSGRISSACEIDFGPGGTIRRKPSIHLNNPKLPLLSSTTRILANQPNEDSRVEIVPSSHVMTFAYKQTCCTDQPLMHTHQSQCQRNHANNSHTIVSRSHASFASCESDLNDQLHTQLHHHHSMLGETPQVATSGLSDASSTASFSTSSLQCAKQSSDAQGQQSISGASVSRSCSTIVRNNIQYGTLKRNNSSVNSHRIVRRVSVVPTTNRIIPHFESFTTGERVSLNSLNSVESSDFSSSSSSSSSASSVCSSSSNGTHSPSSSSSSSSASSSSSSYATSCGKLTGVLSAPSRPSNQCDVGAASIEPKVSFASSSSGGSGGGVNFLPTFATSTSSSSSYSLNCSSCKCTTRTPLSSMHTISNTSSDSLASSVAFAHPVNTFASSTLCKSCRSETSSILSRSVSMLGDQEDDQSDDLSVNTDAEFLSIEKCLLQLNLGGPFSSDQCRSDTTSINSSQMHASASAITNEITSSNGHSASGPVACAAASYNQSQVSCPPHAPAPLSVHHRPDEINQCHAKNSCNNKNNNEHKLRGNVNNGVVCISNNNSSSSNSNSGNNSEHASPLHLRDSWSYAADASPDASDDEELPPPPLDDSRIMARLSNLSLDSLPPPPPELHSLNPNSLTFGSLVKSESRYSLDSFPPPPPPATSLPTRNEPRSQGERSLLPSSLSSVPSMSNACPAPCIPLVGLSTGGHENSSTLLPRQSVNHSSNRGHEFIGRNTNNISVAAAAAAAAAARCKPAPPPPPRSESTRLSSLPLTSSPHPLSH